VIFFVGILKGGKGYSYEIEAILAILSAMARMDEAQKFMVLVASLLQMVVECLK
jgi:hypothetical protein